MTLIGLGLSNRDVATRLTLSVRTVEGHIHKAMAKTGTSQPTSHSLLTGAFATPMADQLATRE